MQNWDPNQPFNDLPPLPPRGFTVSEEIAKQITASRVALARVEQALAMLPSTQIFMTSIPLVESQASSAIENIVTTNDQLFMHLSDQNSGSSGDQVAQVWANRGALKTGFEKVLARPITAKLASELCAILLGHESLFRNRPGTFIGAFGSATYTPPQGEALIRKKLAEWEQFVNQDSGFDPLVNMALAHYQFEAIHPFFDGNGRTGRVLNVLMLVQAGILSTPVLHLSRAINRRRQAYYDALLNVTSKGDWRGWITFMLEIVEQSANEVLQQILRIATLHSDARELIAGSPIKDAYRGKLAELIFERPYFRQRDIAQLFSVSRPTSAGWAETLVTLGLVTPVLVGREKYYVNQAMLDVLA